MRFKVVRDSQARSAVGHRLAIAGARSRAATVGALAVAACGVAGCGLAVTACGNQNAAGGTVRENDRKCDDGAELAITRQHRILCRVSPESQHLQ